MDFKEAEAETVKPVPMKVDEEVAEGDLEKIELDAQSEENENENAEYSYESERSPFPEGEHWPCTPLGLIN